MADEVRFDAGSGMSERDVFGCDRAEMFFHILLVNGILSVNVSCEALPMLLSSSFLLPSPIVSMGTNGFASTFKL